MEGGVAIILLLIILVVAGGIGLALYITGGAIMFGKDREKRKVTERPEHKKVTSPELEHTHFGSRSED